MKTDSTEVRVEINQEEPQTQNPQTQNRPRRPIHNINLPTNTSHQPYFNPDTKNKYGIGCIIFAIVICIAILAASIAYLVFAIRGLVNTSNSDVVNLCNGSSLWLYQLLSLIFGIIQGLTLKYKKDQSKLIKVCKCIFAILIAGGFAGWGGYEIWINSCNSELLGTTLLFEMSRITTILHMCSTGLNIILCITVWIYS